MRAMLVLGLSAFLFAAPTVSFSDQADPAHDAVALFQEHPGKMVGLGVCIGFAVSGPAGIACLAGLGGGLVLDEDLPLLHHVGHSH